MFQILKLNAENLHRKYLLQSMTPVPTTTSETNKIDDTSIRAAWEAKKEVELLRETMESMFLSFGDQLQKALQNNPSAQSNEARSESNDMVLSEKTPESSGKCSVENEATELCSSL